MWNTHQFFKGAGALSAPEASPMASLSNTVCISDPDGQWPTVQVKTVQELSEFGEVARLDTSLVVVAKCILVTFFDVRAAQRVILSSPGRCEPFPPAAHDCRAVRVNLAAFAEKVDHVQGGFNQFGEVANISATHGQAVVEFYDIRAAQMLLAASQGTATPWTEEQAQPAAALLASLGTGGWSTQGSGAPLASLSGVSGLLGMGKDRAHESSNSPEVAEADTSKEGAERTGNRPVRTKVSTKEFSKYDIDPDRIQKGEDLRTTVMVRHICGNNARKDFLLFLEKCGLGDRFSFFYMPCKEHRNVPAGFAFVNFISSTDVHKLYVMVRSGFWREFMNSAQSKAPGVSYARFQGHEELTKHFSSSAVLHEQDGEKRPIFRPEAAAKAAQERQRMEEEKRRADGNPLLLAGAKFPGGVPMGDFMGDFSRGTSSAGVSASDLDVMVAPGLGGGFAGEQNFGGLLSEGVNEIAAILGRHKQTAEAPQKLGSGPPAYVKSQAMPPYPQGNDDQALQVLLAATSRFDHSYFPQQMGA